MTSVQCGLLGVRRERSEGITERLTTSFAGARTMWQVGPDGVNVTGAILADQVRSLDWKIRRAESTVRLPDSVVREALAVSKPSVPSLLEHVPGALGIRVDPLTECGLRGFDCAGAGMMIHDLEESYVRSRRFYQATPCRGVYCRTAANPVTKRLLTRS